MAGLSFQIERDELHERLGGAIPRGALGLLEGEPGSGRSVLCQRITFGVLSNDHKVTYLTTEHNTLGFLRQMHSLGYDIDPWLSSGHLLLLSGYPALARRAPLGEVLYRIIAAKQLWRRDLVVVDDVGSMLGATLLAHGEAEARRVVEALLGRVRRANANGTTVLLTADREGPHALLLQPLRAVAEMFLDLRVDLVGASLARRMLVRRLAGVPERAGDTMGFRVEPSIGILVEIRSVT